MGKGVRNFEISPLVWNELGMFINHKWQTKIECNVTVICAKDVQKVKINNGQFPEQQIMSDTLSEGEMKKKKNTIKVRREVV